MSDEEIKFLCKVYSDLGVFQEDDNTEENVTFLSGRKRFFREKVDEAAERRAALLDPLAPVGGFFFDANKMRVGSAVMRCYAVTKYPAQVSYNWAVGLMNSTDSLTCITYYPGQAADLGNALSRGAKRASRDAASESDLRMRKTYERQVRGADEMLEAMDSQGAALGHMSILSMVIGQDEEQMAQNCQRVITRYASRRMTIKSLANVQKAAFKHVSPYYVAQDVIGDMTKHIVPLVTVAGGYPATVSTIRDDNGVYFARTMDNGIISLDLYYRGNDRTNGNGIVTGTPGIGKSTVIKHLVQSMYMRGAKVIILDPEREFREMCYALGGAWWDAGGGRAISNILQVRDVPLQDEEDENGVPIPKDKLLSPLEQHLQNLYVILKYKLPGLTDKQLELLKRALRHVYSRFGITMDMMEIPKDPEAYPTIGDVYSWLCSHVSEDPEYEDIALFLEDMSIGSEKKIWNRHSDIDLTSDLVVIDTNELVNAPDTTRAAQYYNLLLMAFNAAAADKQTPYLIVADEAHLLFDATVPEAAAIVRQISKRIRKYEGCLWLCFQSLSDMLNDRVAFHGQAVVDNSAYKVLMGCDGKNLSDTVNLFNLNQTEENLLEARTRGVALCLIGSKHIKARFVLSPYKLELMGTGGGR